MTERIVVLSNGNSPLNDLPRFRTWSRSKLSESDIESPFYGWKFDAQLASPCNNFEKKFERAGVQQTAPNNQHRPEKTGKTSIGATYHCSELPP